VLAQLPTVGRDADNATAAAFRSAQTCAINGSDHSSGALAVPLLTPAGCAGVLAIELQHGSEQTRSVRAVATIFAAQLAQLIGGARPAEVRPQPEVMVPPVASFTSPIRRVRR
jgi:GAF domain-containing protein